MNKKSKTLSILFFSIVFSTSAQELITTQGDSYSNASGSIDYSIGEVVIDTGTDGSYYITQGFHQTSWNFVGLEDHFPGYEVTIFPNPTRETLNIETNSFSNVSYSLYDAQGKLLVHGNLLDETTPIDVKHFYSGTYTLVLEDGSKRLKTFKLAKTN